MAALMILAAVVLHCPMEAELFSGWVPRVQQPIDQLESLIETLEQQQPMNFTASNISFLYDAMLYIVFNRVISRLSGPGREDLVDEQLRWLAERETQVNAVYDQFGQGTLAPLVASEVFQNLTRTRIGELEARLGI